jgi:polyhydroxyalkanoate synthesis repressor PhaR
MRLIKRYANRKMYDSHSSRYVTLDGVAELVRAGQDLRIIDNDTGEDLTALTLAQIIFEEQKKEKPPVGVPVLRRIIQQGGAALHEIMTSVDRGREALEELAQRGMQQLSHSGDAKEASKAQKRTMLEDLLEAPQKQLEQLQHRIDAQVRASIERVTGHPAIQGELRRLEENVKSLEEQLRRLRGWSSKTPAKPSGKSPRRRTSRRGKP